MSQQNLNLSHHGPADYISEDFLQVLEEHRKICEKEGKYQEAQTTRKRLKELRRLEDIRKKEILVTKHKSEMKALENAHKAEIRELINKWNNVIIPNFENEASLLEIELKKKHQNELEQFKDQIEKESDQIKVHYSSEVLNLQKRSDILGQQGYYKEAKKLKKKVKRYQSVEREKQELNHKSKFLNKSQLLILKHQREMQNLKKKHASQRENLEQQRKKEFDIIEKRFVNVWSEMEGKFRKEMQKLELMSPIKKMEIREAVLSKNRSFL